MDSQFCIWYFQYLELICGPICEQIISEVCIKKPNDQLLYLLDSKLKINKKRSIPNAPRKWDRNNTAVKFKGILILLSICYLAIFIYHKYAFYHLVCVANFATFWEQTNQITVVQAVQIYIIRYRDYIIRTIYRS